jgi:hypothetical protein
LEEAGVEGGEGRDGVELEERVLQMAVEETVNENGGRWRPWAANGKTVRVGDIILIVDSHPIVPEVSVVRVFTMWWVLMAGVGLL